VEPEDMRRFGSNSIQQWARKHGLYYPTALLAASKTEYAPHCQKSYRIIVQMVECELNCKIDMISCYGDRFFRHAKLPFLNTFARYFL
jgi:hypothetical protein